MRSNEKLNSDYSFDYRLHWNGLSVIAVVVAFAVLSLPNVGALGQQRPLPELIQQARENFKPISPEQVSQRVLSSRSGCRKWSAGSAHRLPAASAGCDTCAGTTSNKSSPTKGQTTWKYSMLHSAN